MKLKTVNVVVIQRVYDKLEIAFVASYPRNAAGIKLAERAFVRAIRTYAKDHDGNTMHVEDDEIEDALLDSEWYAYDVFVQLAYSK